MNHLISVWFLLSIMAISPLNASAKGIDPYQLTLAELGQVQCYTVSRDMTSIEAAPSVITVITAEQIRRHGYRNLGEALERVPGFIAYADGFTHLYGHRGFVEDSIANYLLMIDGHKLNNQMFSHGSQTHLFLHLGNVERIEVVRNPGSTLWGSDASAGIINIITYDGADLDRGESGELQITADYEFVNDRQIGNILYGRDFGDDGDVMLSATYSESDGDWLPAYHADNDGYELYADARPWDPRWNLAGVYGPNYDLYAKYRNRDITFITRFSDTKPSRYQYSDQAAKYLADWPRRHWYADLRYAPELTDHLQLETSLFFDRHEGYFIDPPRYDFNYNTYGANAIATHRLAANRVKAGATYELRDYTTATFLVDPEARPDEEYLWGVFLEENYFGIENWSFTAGIRYDYNSLRSRGGAFYPRASVFHAFNENWSAKYCYNTGHVRQSIRKYRTFTDEDTFSDLVDAAPWVGVEHPHRTQAHDLVLNFQRGKVSSSLILFDMTIEDYSTYIGYTYYNTPEEQAQTGWYGYEYIDQNLGDLNSRGIEVEATYTHSSAIKIYGNAIYSRTKLSDRYITMRGGLHTVDIVAESDMDLVNYDLEKTGWPKYIWNLGVDLEPFDGHVFNLHYRGWTENPVKAEREPNEFDEFGPEHFVDINYVTTIFKEKLELSVYIKNILDNEAEYPAPNDGGYTVNIGRTFGISCKLRL